MTAIWYSRLIWTKAKLKAYSSSLVNITRKEKKFIILRFNFWLSVTIAAIDIVEFLSDIRGLQLPVAVYLQAEAYRQMAESNRTSRVSRQNFQERRIECLKQAKHLLANQADHSLTSVVQRELITSLADETFGSPNSIDLHNNSSTYEDAEDDFYAQTAVTLNRSRRQVEMQGAATLELDQTVKQLSKHICALKDNVDGGMEGMRQEIKSLTEKVNNIDAMHQEIKTLTDKVEELFKKVKISGAVSRETPTRDVDAAAAAAALGLDEFFNMEDTQHSNFLNPALNAQERFFPPGANVPPHPNAAYGSPMFTQNQMYNYYANQAQFMRTPPAQPNFYGTYYYELIKLFNFRSIFCMTVTGVPLKTKPTEILRDFRMVSLYVAPMKVILS